MTQEKINRMETSEILDEINKQQKNGKDIDKELVEGLMNREPFISFVQDIHVLRKNVELLQELLKTHKHAEQTGEALAPL